jgi:hypothetical protein
MTSQTKETTACIHCSDKQEFSSSYRAKQKTFEAALLSFNVGCKVLLHHSVLYCPKKDYNRIERV